MITVIKPYCCNLFWIFLIQLFFGIPAISSAQLTDTTGTSTGMKGAPRAYRPDTRSVAMGEATVADVTVSSSMNLNPASLSLTYQRNTVHLNLIQDWRTDIVTAGLTTPIIRFGTHSAIMQLTLHQSLDDPPVQIGNPLPLRPRITVVQIDLAYSINLKNTVSFGILNSSSLAKSRDGQYLTNYSSIGVIYAPSRSLSYGLVLRGLGRSTTYEILDTGQTILGSQVLRTSLELGATLHYPVEADHHFLSISFSNEKIFQERGIWYKTGAEWHIVKYLALRSGLIIHPEDRLFIPRLGTGLRLGQLSLDYSVSPRNRIHEHFHQFSISYHN